MKAFATAIVLMLGVSAADQARAADLGLDQRYRFGRGWSDDDGPYFITPRGSGFYIECGAPTVPYIEDGYPPNPNSVYRGPVGFRCIRGTYAYESFFPPRCHFGFVRGPEGWTRIRRCT
jgi:hypothetical protein